MGVQNRGRAAYSAGSSIDAAREGLRLMRARKFSVFSSDKADLSGERSFPVLPLQLCVAKLSEIPTTLAGSPSFLHLPRTCAYQLQAINLATIGSRKMASSNTVAPRSGPSSPPKSNDVAAQRVVRIVFIALLLDLLAFTMPCVSLSDPPRPVPRADSYMYSDYLSFLGSSTTLYSEKPLNHSL